MSSHCPFPETPPDARDGGSAVARQRRQEVIEAASEIITQEGLHRLSLSRIEARAKMSRGQLTYYFPTKEAILLAVFDRMLARIFQFALAEATRERLPVDGPETAWLRIRQGLKRTVMGGDGDPAAALGPLVHTFMAQAAHRPDYRERLAATNRDWRRHLARDIAAARPEPRFAPEVVASVVMALFQGLRGQLSVDPEAFDRAAVLELCADLLDPFLRPDPSQESNRES